MKTRLLLPLCLCAVLGVAAHDRYLLPDHTVLSGDQAEVTLIASISNDIFHHDRPLGDDGQGKVGARLQKMFAGLLDEVVLPDGRVVHENGWRAYARFSVRDLSLKDQGTYRVALVQPRSTMLTYKDAEGRPGRAFGADAAAPEGAVDVRRLGTSSRVETYLTLGARTRAAFAPRGTGLDVVPTGHPNDLFVGEPAAFQLLVDGAAPKGEVTVTLVREDTRHRNQRNELSLQPDASGVVTLNFTEAGFHLLKVNCKNPGVPGSGLDATHDTVFLTLEVFPE